MKLRLLGFSVTVLAGLSLPAALSGCDQPAITCSVGHAGAQLGYATIFTKVSGGDCAPVTIDVMGAENFHGVGKAPNTRDLTVDNVAFTIGDNLLQQQRFAACWSTPDDLSGYKPAHDYTDANHTLFSLGKFKDLNPDANDMCFAEDLTSAEQTMLAVPATTADVNPAPTGCPNSPSPACDNGDGSQNPSCICAAKGDDNCCDRFFTYCAGSKVPASKQLAACSIDKDCCDPADAACNTKPVKGSCSSAPVKYCPGGDPDTGLQVGCTDNSTCAPFGVKCTATSISFCSNDPTIVGCASDDDCCAPTDTGCMGKDHTCNPGGVDYASCHTAAQPAIDKKYTWENVQLYETAASPGTQIKADLTYTDGTCTEKFSVFAIWPAIDCTMTDPTTGEHVTDPMTGLPVPDPLSCCPGADPAKGHSVGSSISPDFDVECVPTTSFSGGPPNAFNWVLFSDTAAPFVCAAKSTSKFPAINPNGVPDGCPKPAPIE